MRDNAIAAMQWRKAAVERAQQNMELQKVIREAVKRLERHLAGQSGSAFDVLEARKLLAAALEDSSVPSAPPW